MVCSYKRRLSFARGYESWTIDDWSSIIFSDETHIEVFGRSRVWVQRPRGAASDPQCVCQRMPHSDRVSLWGCFCARGIGQAEIFVGEFDAVKYVDRLLFISIRMRTGGSNRIMLPNTHPTLLRHGFIIMECISSTSLPTLLILILLRTCGAYSSHASNHVWRARSMKLNRF